MVMAVRDDWHNWTWPFRSLQFELSKNPNWQKHELKFRRIIKSSLCSSLSQGSRKTGPMHVWTDLSHDPIEWGTLSLRWQEHANLCSCKSHSLPYGIWKCVLFNYLFIACELVNNSQSHSLEGFVYNKSTFSLHNGSPRKCGHRSRLGGMWGLCLRNRAL